VISTKEACHLTASVLFQNSNRLYALNLKTASDDIVSEAVQGSVNLHYLKFVQCYSPRFVSVQWVTLLGNLRTMILPIKKFHALITSGSRLAISLGNLGTLQDDSYTSVTNAVGQVWIQPDLNSLRMDPRTDKLPPTSSVMSSFCNEDGSILNPDMCPRSILNSLLLELSIVYQTTPLLGFEIEVTFLRIVSTLDDVADDQLVPIDGMRTVSIPGLLTYCHEHNIVRGTRLY
jgi:glutamine synthetase